MGDFGVLHRFSLPPQALDTLRAHCMSTSPDAVHTACGCFAPHVMSLLHQGHLDSKKLLCVKLPDGYAIVTDGKEHKIVSLIEDSEMCQPAPQKKKKVSYSSSGDPYCCRYDDDDIDYDGAEQQARPNATSCTVAGAHITVSKMQSPQSHGYSLAQDQRMPPMRAMTLVHHDGLVQLNQASRFSPVGSIISQLVGHIPLQQEPRMLMAAPCMGSLTGRNLMGPEADFAKRVFFAAVAQAAANGKNGPSGVYNTPINMSNVLCKLLMLRQPSKPIQCGRLSDGIIGFRGRSDGRHSLVFVGSSDDFNDARPAPVAKSNMKLVKITYNNNSAKAHRIFVHVPGSSGGAPSLGEFGTPPVIPGGDMCVADVMSILEHGFRTSTRAGLGCQNYPIACKEAAANRLRFGGDSSSSSAHDDDACRRILDACGAFGGAAAMAA